MRLRKVVSILCSGFLISAAGSGAEAAAKLNSSKSNVAKVKSSKSNTSDRVSGAPKARAKGAVVKSKSNITNN
jgi:hypothetical protein